MATLNQGILGGFSGKVGTVVGSIWKGIAVIRAYTAHVTNPNTPAQVEQRAKFKLMVQFLRPLVAFLRIGFAYQAVKMTAFNAALKNNLEKVVTGLYPDFSIDYSQVMVSEGNLSNATNLDAVSVLAGKVDVTWDNNAGEGGALATDDAMIVIYDPTLSRFVTSTSGATRLDGTQTITVPDSFIGHQVHVYAGFKSKDAISNSEYITAVNVA